MTKLPSKTGSSMSWVRVPPSDPFMLDVAQLVEQPQFIALLLTENLFLFYAERRKRLCLDYICSLGYQERESLLIEKE